MAQLTKKQLVLDISLAIDHAVSNVILFEYREDDTEFGFVSHSVVMPRKEWSALGCPMQITIAIVPGDTLNKKEST